VTTKLQIVVFALMLGALAMPRAQTQAQAEAESDDAVLRRVEAYLNGITTLAANFLQVNHDGSISEGEIVISRPGRMRIDYAPPLKVEIISDGSWITYIDRELGQISQAPLNGSHADFLLRKNLSFDGDVVVSAITRQANVIEITFDRKANPGQGSMTLVFADNPLELRQWVVVDAQRLTTRVTLFDTRFGLDLDPALFDAPEPFPSGD
jgi:outer membrane lipoprotein-sorting protein